MIEQIAAVFTIDLAFAAAVAIVSGVIHGYTGFGAALVMAPLLSLLYGPVEALALMVITALLGSAQVYPQAARTALWREVAPLSIGVVVATPLGIAVLFSADPVTAGQILNIQATIHNDGAAYDKNIGLSTEAGGDAAPGIASSRLDTTTYDWSNLNDGTLGAPSFPGSIDEVMIWRRNLFPHEVRDLFASYDLGRPPFYDDSENRGWSDDRRHVLRTRRRLDSLGLAGRPFPGPVRGLRERGS